MTRILVVGSLNMDMVIRVPRLPVPGETVLGQSPCYVNGGKGANQAFTCARLGADTAMLGAVGDDENGRALLNGLSQAGLDIQAVRRFRETETGLAVIAVDDAGGNHIIVSPGANNQVTPRDVANHRDLVAQSDAVIMQLEIPLETVTVAACLARELGRLVVLDPAPAAPLPEKLLAAVDVIKPNEVELARLTGRRVETLEEAAEAAGDLLKLGVGTVVASLGANGALVVDTSGARHFPAVKNIRVVDTTAAGDAFTAAMTMLLAEGRGLSEAVAFAVKVSALVVSRPGAQTSVPTAEEAAAFRPL